MVSPPSFLAPAAAALALAAATLVPRAAAAPPRASFSSVLKPGGAPMMKGSEFKPKRKVAASGLHKGLTGTARRMQKGSQYCYEEREPKFAVNESPGEGACLNFPSKGRLYKYEEDFVTYGPVLNKMSHYKCPASGVRVIESNSIPNHDIEQGNLNFPCEQLAYFELPLVPTRASQRTEAPPQGKIGVATNGVHLFGAQEAAGGSALKAYGDFRDARFWYGHATQGKVSHYHSPNAGHDPDLPGGPAGEDELLGWALDGYGIYGFTDEELDECNGRVGEDGEYRYHVRYPDGWDPVECWDTDMPSEYCSASLPGANNWNYILGCYWGNVTNTKIGNLTSYQRPDDCVLTPISGPPPAPTPPAPTPPGPPSGPPPGKRPNFIVMQPDDLPFFEDWSPPAHYDGGTAGAVPFPDGGMPNLAAMMAGGLTMGQAYAASSTCGTSRYSTITGRYPSRSSYGRNKQHRDDLREVVIPSTKLEDINAVPDGMDCGANNVAQLFNASGYRTGIVGKWHLHSPADTYNYTEAQASIRACGFDYAEAVYPENMGGAWASPGNNGGRNITHNMEHVVARGIEFMEASIQAEDPFFLYLNPTVPHNSGDVSWALEQGDCRDTVEGRLGSDPHVPYGMTDGGARTCREYRADVIQRAGQGADDKELGSIWVDDAVGAIYDYLKESGELENTFFLFQQDHGQEGKGTVYEQGLRIFQLVHYPDAFDGGKVFNGLVSTVDIAPTMLDYAGIGLSYGMDGESWKAAAENDGGATDWDDRCLVFELQKDRAVRCGCDKLLFIGGTSTTRERGVRSGFSFNTDGNGNITDTFFDLCGGGSGPSVATPGDNPETNGTAYTPSDAVVQRLTTELNCHIDKTAPSRLVVPDYSGCGNDPTDPPCVDLETFPQRAGNAVGTLRNCTWVWNHGKCLRYKDECRATCGNCTAPEPTPGPAPAPPPEPTFQPVLNSSEPGPWDIHFLSLSNNFSASSGKEVSTDFFVGKGREHEAFLFAKDCRTNITDISFTTTKVVTNKNATHDHLSVHQSVDKSSIGNSSVWNNTSNMFEVCQVVRLVLPASESGGNGKMVISEDIRQIAVTFDLFAQFNVTAGLQSGTVFNVTSTTDISSYVNAYKCTSSNDFRADDSALSPNKELFVCIISIADEVNVDRLVSMTASQQGNTEANLNVIQGGDPSINSITSIQYVSRENGVVVGTRLPINTFNYAAGAPISIQGDIQMKLADGGTSRKLRTLVDTDIEGDEKASYALEVDLEEGDAVIDGVVSATGNSAIAAAALDKAFAVAAAVVFVFAAL